MRFKRHNSYPSLHTNTTSPSSCPNETPHLEDVEGEESNDDEMIENDMTKKMRIIDVYKELDRVVNEAIVSVLAWAVLLLVGIKVICLVVSWIPEIVWVVVGMGVVGWNLVGWWVKGSAFEEIIVRVGKRVGDGEVDVGRGVEGEVSEIV